MNFGKIVKREIADKSPKDRCCKKAFLAGVMRGGGKLVEIDGQLSLELAVVGQEANNLICSLLAILYGYEVKPIILNKKEQKYLLVIEGERVYDILLDLDILLEDENGVSVNMQMYGNLTKKECCQRSFIKGLFLSSGSCTAPSENDSKNTKYHLELPFSHTAPAEQTARVLFDKGVQIKIMRRKNKFVAYIKSVEEINNFLAYIGAHISLLKLADLVAMKEFVNNVNRQQNCELANIDRQIEASEKYKQAINKIESAVGLESLKKDLLTTAKAKKDYPEDSLFQLAERLGISKSCLTHRLRKLVEIASTIN